MSRDVVEKSKRARRRMAEWRWNNERKKRGVVMERENIKARGWGIPLCFPGERYKWAFWRERGCLGRGWRAAVRPHLCHQKSQEDHRCDKRPNLLCGWIAFFFLSVSFNISFFFLAYFACFLIISAGSRTHVSFNILIN